MTKPKVSIVIPVYNGANYMREAIDSALAQTYSNTEILVINDGSRDNGETERIAQSYGEQIRYLAKPNGGVATALNLGIESMTGEYFSWLSHDDVYLPNKVEHQMRFLQSLQNPQTIVYSDYQLIDAKSRVFSSVTIADTVSTNALYDLVAHQAIHGCAMLIHKDAFKKCGNFDVSLPTTQDYDLWVRMAQVLPFQYCPGIIIQSRQHPEQGSRQAFHRSAVFDFFHLHLNKITSDIMKKSFPETKSRMKAYENLLGRLANVGLSGLFFNLTLQGVKDFDSLGNKIQFLFRSLFIYAYKFLFGMVKRLLPESLKQSMKTLIRKASTGLRLLFTKPSQLDFTEIYKKNIFGSSESHSGEGSTLQQTDVIREEIPKILEQYKIQSFLDIPCGDMNWMKLVDLGKTHYIGADIVQEIVDKNKSLYQNENRSFELLNLISSQLPKVDLIFCRDCLVHMNYQDALAALQNMKRSGSKYLLTTTFTDRSKNENLYGIWRPINLQQAPFSLPKPIVLINENCTEANRQFTDKSLALWRLDDLSFPS